MLTRVSRLLFALFADNEMEGEEGDWHAPSDAPWPTLLLPPETPTLLSPPLLSPSNTSNSLNLSLCGSRSFTEDVYEELGKHDMRSLVYNFESSSQSNLVNGADDDDAITGSILKGSFTSGFTPIKDEQAESLQIDGVEDDPKVSQKTMPVNPPIQHKYSEASKEEALTSVTAIHRSATLHKVTRAASSTTDINKINEMNEQDPAFVRATEGLRASGGSQIISNSRDSDIAEPRLSLESTDRSSTIPTKPKLLSSVSSGFRSLRRRPTT